MRSDWIGWGLHPLSGALTGHRGTHNGGGHMEQSRLERRAHTPSTPGSAGSARSWHGASARDRPASVFASHSWLRNGERTRFRCSEPPVCGGVSRSLGTSHGAPLEECPAGKAQLCGPARRGWGLAAALGRTLHTNQLLTGFPDTEGAS